MKWDAVQISTERSSRVLDNGKRSIHMSWLLFVFFYAIFANVPFWAASYYLGLLPVGWFCLEYAGVGLFALFVPRIVAATLLMLIIAVDLVSAVSKTYYLSPSECLANIGALYEFHGARFLAMATVASFILLVFSIAAFFPRAAIGKSNRFRTAACLIAFAAIAMFVDCFEIVRETGHMPSLFRVARPSDKNKYSDYRNLWIARYPLIRLKINQMYFGGSHNVPSASEADFAPIPSASALAARSAGLSEGKSNKEMPNVVVVLVESWGLDSDLPVRDSLVKPYSLPNVIARYEVLQGTVPFYGSTIAGEARELCGNHLGFHILNISTQEAQGCFPDRLSALGYHSLAVHGLDGHMFNRSTWYRKIGFQEQWFGDELRKQKLPDCAGAFVGTCDAEIAEWIGRRLEKQDASPDFVYWMTLNSHLPVPIPSGLRAGAPCLLIPLLSQQQSLCSWYQLVSNVHYSISLLAMTKLARPTIFVIVGDHAPPFANPTLRNQFSSTDVPFVLLLPRKNGGIVGKIRN